MLDAERFWSKVEKTDSCWVWVGARNPSGYGTFAAGSKKNNSRRDWRAHRYAYTVEKGSIPAGLDLDHLCRNPSCVRPDHLEPVTHRVNILRGVGTASRNAAKTHCPQGHPYDEKNTYVSRTGARLCRACNRIKVSFYKKRKRLGLGWANPFS